MPFQGVNLPSDLMDEERFKALPSTEKEQHLRGVLRKLLELNSNGLTVSQISKALGSFSSRPTVWRHLETMVVTREAYKLEFGRLMVVYYPNGKMIHPLFKEDIQLGDRIYAFYFVRNNFGDFAYLQEKNQNRLGVETICGGLILPVNEIETFINRLTQAKKKVVELVRESKG